MSHVQEGTELKLRAWVRRTKSVFGESASKATFKFFIDGKETDKIKPVSIEAGTKGEKEQDKKAAHATITLPNVDDAADSYVLRYEAKLKSEAKALDFSGNAHYDVWPAYINLTLTSDDQAITRIPFDLVQGQSRTRHTAIKGTALRVPLRPGPWTVETVSPFELVEWTKDKGRDRTAKVKRKPYTAQIYLPSAMPAPNGGNETEVKWYVNMPDSATKPEGKRLTFGVGAATTRGLALTGDKLYLKVKWADELSACVDPNAPRRLTTFDKSNVATQSAGAAGTEVTKEIFIPINGGLANFTLELGYAGGDSVTVHVGVTDACSDHKVKIVNWRRVAFEHFLPQPNVLSHFTILDPNAASFSQAQHNLAQTELTESFIEIDTAANLGRFYGDAQLGTAINQIKFDAAYFGQTAGQKVTAMTPDVFTRIRNVLRPGNQAKHSISVLWADWYLGLDAGNAYSLAVTSAAIEAGAKGTGVEIDLGYPNAAFKLDPSKTDGSLGIAGLAFYATEWRDGGNWRPIAAGDPGFDWSFANAQWVALNAGNIDQYIEWMNFRRIKVKFPAAPNQGDPGVWPGNDDWWTSGGRPLKLCAYVDLRVAKNNVNASGWHGFINMSTFGGQFQDQGVINTLLHELGHNLGQAYAGKAVDATYGRTPANAIPGVAFPAGVPTGLVYGGKGHTGTHCAAGVSEQNRGSASFVTPENVASSISSQATCIMFGSGSMNSGTSLVFCADCRKYIRATDASDYTKTWET